MIGHQQAEAKVELQEVRQASVVHKERADRNGARLLGVNKEFFTLSETAEKVEAAVQSKTAEVAALRVQKEELVKQVAQADQELRPVKQRKTALESDVRVLRDSNVELNAQLQASTEDMAVAHASASDGKTRMDAAQSSSRRSRSKGIGSTKAAQSHSRGQRWPEGTKPDVNGNRKHSTQSTCARVCAEMQKVVSQSEGVESELETLRSSNMSATQQADALTRCDERCAELRAKKEKLLRESSITDEDMKTLQSTADANAKALADMGADAADADRKCSRSSRQSANSSAL